MQEATGMTGPNHTQVSHFHQELGPEVGNVVFAMIYVVFKGEEVSLLTFLYLICADQTRPV